MLSAQRIVELASLPNVKGIAVGNFLNTLDDLSYSQSMANLSYDAMLYDWNDETFDAIFVGIKEHFER